MNEKTKKILAISATVLGILALIGVAAFTLLADHSQIKKTATVEAGGTFNFVAKDYFDMEKKDLAKLYVDTTDLDTTKIGEYKVPVKGAGKTYYITVTVEDTVAPVIRDTGVVVFTNDMKKIDVTTLGEYYDICECTQSVDTFQKVGDLKVIDETSMESYKDNLVFDKSLLLDIIEGNATTYEEGVYTARYRVTDTSGNYDIVEVLVVLDKTPAYTMEELSDITVEQTDVTVAPTPKYFAFTDNVDGLVSEDACEFTVELADKDANKYSVTQSYTDRAGNKTETGYFITVVAGQAADTQTPNTSGGGQPNNSGTQQGGSENGGTSAISKYTFTEMNKTMYVTGTVNVRNLPSKDGEKVGSLSKGTQVIVTGKCNETGWYRFDFDGASAYVSSSYLSENKPTGSGSTGKTDPNSLKEGESVTIIEEDGTPCTYNNWNGFIIKSSTLPEVTEMRKALAYAPEYEIVVVGNSAGMRLPKDVFSNTEVRQKYWDELLAYVHAMGYYAIGGSGGDLDINFTTYIISCNFEKWE